MKELEWDRGGEFRGLVFRDRAPGFNVLAV